MVRCGACGSLLEVALNLPAAAPLPNPVPQQPPPPSAPAALGQSAVEGGPGSGGSDLFFGEVSLSDLLTAGLDREGILAPITGESAPGAGALEGAEGGGAARDLAGADDNFLEEVRGAEQGEREQVWMDHFHEAMRNATSSPI